LNSARFLLFSLFLGLSLLLNGLDAWAATRDWTFSDQANYIFDSDKIEFDSGQAQLKSPAWWDSNWQERRGIIIDNRQNSSDLIEYQIQFRSDFLTGMQADGSDIRIVDAAGTTLAMWIQAINASSVTICAQIPLIAANSVQTIFMYYGNASATSVSDKDAVFSYSSPQPVYYMASTRDYDLVVATLKNGNSVTAESTDLWLTDQQRINTFTASVIQPGTALKVLKPISSRLLVGQAAEGAIPVSWAGTQFAYGGMRATDVWDFYSPFADANVTIYQGTTQVDSFTVLQGQAVERSVDITSGSLAIIEADVPVLAHHQSTDGSDGFNLYPASTEIYGINSTTVYIGVLSDNTQVTAYTSSGGTPVNGTYNRGTQISITGGSSYGAGDAIRIVADKPVNAIQQADSDGSESTTFLPSAVLDKLYVLPTEADYIAICCPEQNTTVWLLDAISGNTITSATSTAGSAPYPSKILFSQSASESPYAAGTVIIGDKDFYVYYEDSATDDETNLYSEKDVRKYAYPEPVVNLVGEFPYPMDNPTVEPITNSAQVFTTLSSFVETATVPSGTAIRYIISNDNGSTWYYYNGGWVVSDQTYTQASTASEINSNISTLLTSSGSFRFRAFLSSTDGNSRPQLDNVQLGYAGGGLVISEISSSYDEVYQRLSNIPVTMTVQNTSELNLTITDSSLTFSNSTVGYIVIADANNPTTIPPNSTVYLYYLVEIGSVVPPGTCTVDGTLSATSAVKNYDLTGALNPLSWTVLDYARGELTILEISSPLTEVARKQKDIPVSMRIQNSSQIELDITDSTLYFSNSEVGYIWVAAPTNPVKIPAASTIQLDYTVEISQVVPLGTVTIEGTLSATSEFKSFNLTGSLSPWTWTVFDARNAFYHVRPTRLRLSQRSYTTIDYEVEKDEAVSIKIYNVSGELVKVLVDGYPGVGKHSVNWYADNGEVNSRGQTVASGVYLVVLQIGDYKQIRKMIVVK